MKRCVVSSPTLLSRTCGGLQPKECVGKTVRELFGRQALSLDRAVRIVAGNKKTLRNLFFLMAAEKKVATQYWVADVCSSYDRQKSLLWIGVAFCELPAGSILQKRLLHPAHSDSANGSGSTRRSGRKSEAVAAHDGILKRTVTVLDSSMSLRRNIAESRIAATLSREGWPNTTVESIEPTNDPLFWQRNGNGLNLSTRTVETYRAWLMNKLELHSAAELIRYALRNHLIAL